MLFDHNRTRSQRSIAIARRRGSAVRRRSGAIAAALAEIGKWPSRPSAQSQKNIRGFSQVFLPHQSGSIMFAPASPADEAAAAASPPAAAVSSSSPPESATVVMNSALTAGDDIDDDVADPIALVAVGVDAGNSPNAPAPAVARASSTLAPPGQENSRKTPPVVEALKDRVPTASAVIAALCESS